MARQLLNLQWTCPRWRMFLWWWEQNETRSRLALPCVGDLPGSDHSGIHSCRAVFSRCPRTFGADVVLLWCARHAVLGDAVDGNLYGISDRPGLSERPQWSR